MAGLKQFTDSVIDLMMKNRSLRLHFLALYVILVIVCGIIVPALSVQFSLNAFGNYLIQRRQADIENLGESLTNLYAEEGGIWKRRRVMDILRPSPQWNNMIISLLDSQGREVFTLRPLQQMNRRWQNENNNNAPEDEFEKSTIKLTHEQKHIGSLEVSRRLPSVHYEFSFIGHLTYYTLVGAFIMIIIACWVGYLVSGRLSRPVIKAIALTRRISKGDYDINEKLPTVGIRELDDLMRGVEELGKSLAGQEKLRRRLMVDVSHELRTPLTVVRTQIEAIADGIFEPTPERLANCLNEINRLGTLIANVDALTRLEGEVLEIRTEKTNMRRFIEPSIDTFAPVFERIGINFTNELENDIYANIDAKKFRHVIDNLLSNAARYTNKGGTVNVKLYKQDKQVIIKVSDTGIGISEKDLPNIFERFYRADESRARVTGGSGVGLAIVKATVDAHNGKVYAESVKGQGSCFTIELPCRF